MRRWSLKIAVAAWDGHVTWQQLPLGFLLARFDEQQYLSTERTGMAEVEYEA